MNLFRIGLLALGFGAAPAALAHNFHQIGWFGSTDSAQVGMGFMTSKTEYETEAGNNFDLDRKIFGVDTGFNMGDDIAVFGQLGRIMSTELTESRDFRGDGFLLGFGAKTIAYRGTKAVIVPYGQFNYLTEDLQYKPNDDVNAKIEGESSIYEFVVGSNFELHANQRFTPFAGFELFPLNQGEIKFKKDVAQIGEGDTAIKVPARTIENKRNDVLNLRFGAAATFTNFALRGEVTMISETSFLFGGSFRF